METREETRMSEPVLTTISNPELSSSGAARRADRIDWNQFEVDKRKREFTEAANLPPRHANRTKFASPQQWQDALQAVTNALGGGSTLALIGRRGTGKTQIAVEASRRRLMECKSVLYTLAMDVFIVIKGSYAREAGALETEIIARFVRPSLLVIDEITQRGETDWENRMLTHILDRRYLAERDTILIGNLKADELKANVGASVVSRLNETGGIIECNWQSFREQPTTKIP
jgi:DNA replication protein DnaC